MTLTPQEKEIAGMRLVGDSLVLIASRLGISQDELRDKIQLLMSKLGFQATTQKSEIDYANAPRRHTCYCDY